MRIEGEVIDVPMVWARIEAGEIVLADRTRFLPGVTAIRLPDGVVVKDWSLPVDLLAQGLDYAGLGRQYGNRLYVRNHGCTIIDATRLANVTVAPVPEPVPESVVTQEPVTPARKARQSA